ncbi:uncharacterized protein LOC116302849 [Actinia tenebrosa]|uniref:Uncharacterized protein LOC116302849 n=1 Tax=Actinia tenebrosa TaxID=6105 RepID=A0A6P8IMQ5_ACTTE|nr:uncharacterized protein LOC116302849 [Actinia tenebrosa]
MDIGRCFFVLLFLCLNNRISESFRWTRNQQSSQSIDIQLGSDVSLPCEFLLTSEEESAMQDFHLIYWTREIPAGSQSWQGIASKTNLVSNSDARIMHHDKSRILMKNNSLTILSVKPEDDALYQCEVKSSFYTTPSVIKLNVLKQIKKTSEQHSSISNKASAGIGVGVTLLVVALIILGVLFFKAKLARGQRRTETERSTNLAYIPRNNENSMAGAYDGPAAFNNSEMNINGAVNKSCRLDGAPTNVTSF